MAVIRIAGFVGENRAIEPKLLPDSVMTVSNNQKPGRGDLRPWRTPVMMTITPNNRVSIYRMGRDNGYDTIYWCSWATVVHAVRGFSATDTTEQTFYTGDGAPKMMNNLALSSNTPTPNPTVNRPMGLPAPLSAPLTAPNSLTVANLGKYKLKIEDTSIATLVGGDVYRVSVGTNLDDADTIALITLNEDATLRRPTATTLAAQLDAISGISATVVTASATESGGVLVLSDAVGVKFAIEKKTGTSSSYTYGDSTLTDYLLAYAQASSYSNVTIGTTIGAGSMVAGHTYRIQSVADSDFTLVGAPSNSSMAIFTATGPTTGNGTVDNVTSVTGTNYTCTITISAAQIAAMTVGQRFAFFVNTEPSVSVTVGGGANTYPSAVTADSVKTAFTGISNVTAAIVTNATTGARSVTLSLTTAYAGSVLRLQSITPGTTDNYETYATGAEVVEDTTSDISTYYVYTYVNDLGWESAPSPVSLEDVRNPEATSVLSGFAAPPSGNYNITLMRIYKTQTGSSTNFYFMKEVAISTTTVTDTNAALGELLETATWLPPPGIPTGGSLNTTEPTLSFLTPMWNGMMAGISGNSVRVCEPYTPYAWPAAYDVLPPDGTPVGMGVFGQNLLILTTSRPVLVTGSSPDGLDQQRVEMQQSCVASRSIVSMGSGVAWASDDGLCWYGAGGPRLLTAGIMLREDWQAMSPSSIIGSLYEGLYFGSYLAGDGARKAFLIDPNSPQGIFFLDGAYSAFHFDETRDQMHVLEGTVIKKWDAGTTFMTYKVRSKTFKQPYPQSYAAAEVVATSYPVTFRLYADGNLVHTKSVLSRGPFRLPAVRAMDFAVEIEGTNPVQGVALATTMKELSEV